MIIKSTKLLAVLILAAGCSACADDKPTDKEATEALRQFIPPLRTESPFRQGVVKIQSCEKSPEVAGFKCLMNWHYGDGKWIGDRLAGFSKTKEGKWVISEW